MRLARRATIAGVPSAFVEGPSIHQARRIVMFEAVGPFVALMVAAWVAFENSSNTQLETSFILGQPFRNY